MRISKKLNEQNWIIHVFAFIGMFTVIYLSLCAFYDRGKSVKIYIETKLQSKYEKTIIIPRTHADSGTTDGGNTDDQPGNRETNRGIFSAYNSVKEQTDGNPYITADGTDLRKVTGCVIANNSLKMGSRIDVEGIGVCEVHDRMNSRYDGSHFDIYFGDDIQKAKEFGRKELSYEII